MNGQDNVYLVRHGETGLLVQPRDVDDLAGALRCLAADRDLRARLGAAGREAVLGRFSAARVAERITGIYDRLVLPSG